MKGILGRKIGMTQVFNEHGRSIPVTIIETQDNYVSAIKTKQKDGYDALQLAVFDKRQKSTTQPLQGHFKKSGIAPKQFVNEIRNMAGHGVGSKVSGEIFKSGELVDVRGIVKGHGFQGTIKRNNQKIGPKSHGGGGGSQPIRQTGSLGDMVSNRVFKNMTMPGHMGAVQRTVQNLEVVAYDDKTQSLLIKGSIPGPRKSFVVITQAVKGLPAHAPVKLVNVRETILKNELLEEARRYGADINTDMSLADMRAAIDASRKAREAEEAAAAAKAVADKLAEEEAKTKLAAEAAHREAEAARASGNTEQAEAAEAKAEQLEHKVEVLEAKEKAVEAEVKRTAAAAVAAEKIAESLQVETEAEVEEAMPKDQKANDKGGK